MINNFELSPPKIRWLIGYNNFDIFTSVPADNTPAFGYLVIDFVTKAPREEDKEPQLDEDEGNGSYEGYVHPNWETRQNSKFVLQFQVTEWIPTQIPIYKYRWNNIITYLEMSYSFFW